MRNIWGLRVKALVRSEGNAPEFQYLGQRGYTSQCVEAVITILTSPKPPEYITVVFKKFSWLDKETTSVAFIAWNWLGVNLTIVPDGFVLTKVLEDGGFHFALH